MKKKLHSYFRPLVRCLFIKSNIFFSERMADFILRFVYRCKLLCWLKAHPCREFNSHFGQNNRYNLYQFIFETEHLEADIDYLEFGVARGSSFIWWSSKNKHPKSRFVGFDTFTGLPEAWDNVPAGSFTVHRGIPQIQDSRCIFEVGLFQDTLFGFLGRFALDRRTVVHIDCDLYSSTLFVLTALAPRLKKNDIIMFDELGSIRHPTHEFRALCDFLSVYKLSYKVIGACDFYYSVALKLT